MISALAIDASASGAARARRAARPTAASPGRTRSRSRPPRAPSTTRTGSSATRGLRARTTATATRSGTTPGRQPILMSTSTDGGLTWGPRRLPAGSPRPRRPAGRPAERERRRPVRRERRAIRSFRSTDGGEHAGGRGARRERQPAQRRRRPPHVAAALGRGRRRRARSTSSGRTAASGRAARRTTSSCSTSTDGVTWSAVTRVPIDATTSGVDHFIPGIAVDRATSGSDARGSRSATTTTRSATARSSHVPADGRLRLVDRRRRDLEPPPTLAGPMSLSLDREHEPGPDGRRLHVDLVHRRRQGAPGLRDRRSAPTGSVFASERTASATFAIPSPRRSAQACVPGNDRPVSRGKTKPHGTSSSRARTRPLRERRTQGVASSRGGCRRCSSSRAALLEQCSRHRSAATRTRTRQPARDPGRGRLVRFREHDRRRLPDRAVRQRRRRQQHRLVDLDRRRPSLGDGRPSRHDPVRRRALGADQRPGRRVRPLARRLDDLDPRLRDGRVAVRVPERHARRAARPTEASRGRTRSPRHSASSTTRTGSPATPGPRARTTATATRSGTTTARATGC